jgi:hypothetical protein
MLAELTAIKAQKADIAKRETQITETLTDHYRAELAGKVGTHTIDGVKFYIPKQVKWDQSMLHDLFEQCKASNENPLDYLSISYDVPESRYKAWPTSIRESFEPARTVTTGKIKIQFGKED